MTTPHIHANISSIFPRLLIGRTEQEKKREWSKLYIDDESDLEEIIIGEKERNEYGSNHFLMTLEKRNRRTFFKNRNFQNQMDKFFHVLDIEMSE